MKVKGLPFDIDKGRLANHFKIYNITEENVFVEYNNFKGNGMALIRFPTVRDCNLALANLDGSYIDGRYIVLDKMPKRSIE